MRVHPEMDKLIRAEMLRCRNNVTEITGKKYKPTTSQATRILAKRLRELSYYEKDSIQL